MLIALGAMALVVALAAPPILLSRWANSEAALARRGDRVAVSAEAVPRASVVTPLLSARRVPGVVSRQLATKPLIEGLAAVGRQLPAGACLRVEVDGAPVFSQRDDTALIPASNMKIVTAAVALDKLGGDHVFSTSAAGIIDGASVVGDLYLVGGGDPVLSTDDFVKDFYTSAEHYAGTPNRSTRLEDLADKVAALGITTVTGSVVGDDTRYDSQRYLPTWPSSYATSHQTGPLGALFVNDGYSVYQPAARRATAADPARQAAAALARLLADRGVAVAGAAGRSDGPTTAPVLASIDSRPLSELVGEMLTSSDNDTAELFVKELGHKVSGEGTWSAGLAVVSATLVSWGIDISSLALLDGSGLDTGDRMTCRALVAVLRRAALDGPLVAGLPVAGRPGTLDIYFRGGPMEGILRAKTGTLSTARSLSGVVPASGGHLIDFAFLVNGRNADTTAVGLWPSLADAFASYPYSPDLSAYSPAPPSVG